MYNNGEIYRVMDSFEKTLKVAPIYVGGTTDRAEMIEVSLNNGRTSTRFKTNNYYNDGDVNRLFIMFLQGYSAGKCEERMS